MTEQAAKRKLEKVAWEVVVKTLVSMTRQTLAKSLVEMTVRISR